MELSKREWYLIHASLRMELLRLRDLKTNTENGEIEPEYHAMLLKDIEEKQQICDKVKRHLMR